MRNAQHSSRPLSVSTVTLAAGIVLGLGAMATWSPRAVAYQTYSAGCVTCHGDFAGPTSPKGTVFPGNSKHTMHRSSSYMGTACNLCHMAGSYSPVYTYQSAGTANNPGIGCVGCHGEYYGATLGYMGPGLRRHHALHNVTVCAGCHTDDPLPKPEGTKPKYYGTADTHADDACNSPPAYKEHWSVNGNLGLDNDGDGFYDVADPDCHAVLGDLNCDGAVNFGDIDPFVLALSDPNTYEQMFPGCNILHGDCNNDGLVDFADIDPFVALLSG